MTDFEGDNSITNLIYDDCNEVIKGYLKMVKIKGEIRFLIINSDATEANTRNPTFKNYPT